MSKLICLVGLQCSGKSTFAKKLAEENKQVWSSTSIYHGGIGGCAMTEAAAPIVSSDEIRKEYPDWDNEKVFKEVYNRINLFLQNGAKAVIFDATNVTIKSRKGIFERVKEPCEKICYIINTPIEICRERLKERNKIHKTIIEDNSCPNCHYKLEEGYYCPNCDCLQNPPHYVPEEVLEKYLKLFQVPFKEEGWDEMHLFDRIKKDYNLYTFTFQTMSMMDQNNRHHTQMLGDHSRSVWQGINNYISSFEQPEVRVLSDLENDYLRDGCELHDVGKLWTRVPNKSNPEMSSYYNHAEVGAYWKLCHGWTIEEAFYENYHMILNNDISEKTKNKYKELFGEEKYRLLEVLHDVDMGVK